MTVKTVQSSSLDYSVPISAPPEHRDLREIRLVLFMIFGNVLAASAALLLASFLMIGFMPTTPAAISTLQGFLTEGAAGLIALLLLQFLAGLYRRDSIFLRRNSIKNLSCIVTWILLFAIFALLTPLPQFNLFWVATSGALMAIMLPSWQLLFRKQFLSKAGTDQITQNVAIIGWNREAEQLSKHVNKHGDTQYRIVAHLQHGDNDHPRFICDVAELESMKEIHRLIETKRVDAIIVANYDMATEEIFELHRLCGREMVDFIMMPPFLNILRSGIQLETVGNVPLMTVSGLPLQDPLNRCFKRMIDIAGALVGLTLAAPIIAVFAALVYKESPGPVFFRQKRIGKKGRVFEMIKIRSMKLESSQSEKAAWTTANDNRRLKIGTLMRKLNIDELPQFWNVLQGEMSLVGPRPEQIPMIEDFKHDIENYNFRHIVKPGLTGWAQIHGWRGDTCLQARINHDLEYMEKWSPWLDLYIMVRTFTARENAY